MDLTTFPSTRDPRLLHAYTKTIYQHKCWRIPPHLRPNLLDLYNSSSVALQNPLIPADIQFPVYSAHYNAIQAASFRASKSDLKSAKMIWHWGVDRKRSFDIYQFQTRQQLFYVMIVLFAPQECGWAQPEPQTTLITLYLQACLSPPKFLLAARTSFFAHWQSSAYDLLTLSGVENTRTKTTMYQLSQNAPRLPSMDVGEFAQYLRGMTVREFAEHGPALIANFLRGWRGVLREMGDVEAGLRNLDIGDGRSGREEDDEDDAMRELREGVVGLRVGGVNVADVSVPDDVRVFDSPAVRALMQPLDSVEMPDGGPRFKFDLKTRWVDPGWVLDRIEAMKRQTLKVF